MELNREECISELDTKIKYAKFANTNAVVLSSKAAQFCLEHAQYYEQKIKELTEENERLRADKDYWKNRAKESESEYDQAVKRGYEHGTVYSVRAFDERAKAKAYTNNYCQEVVLLSDIDQIAKEMLEGEK